MKRVLLMRHGEAVDASVTLSDDARYLTPRGRRVSRAVAAWLAANERPSQIVTSPLVRATQTAEIVAAALGAESVTVSRALATGDLRALQAAVREGPEASVLFVGHEPTLSAWVEALTGRPVTGTEKSSVWVLDVGPEAAAEVGYFDPHSLRFRTG